MFHLRAQTIALLLGLVAALPGAESHSLPAQLSPQEFINTDLGASELVLSMVVNQVAVLKLLNESSNIYSMHERELDEKTEELKSELQNIKETALQQFQNMATATLSEINARNEETRQMLHDVKEKALNVSRQNERELDEKTEELKSELQNIKETAFQQFHNMATATLSEINARNEETRQMLHDVKETALNKSHQSESLLIATTSPTAAIITTTATPRICERSWREYQSSCYKVFKTKVDNRRATENCRALGANLASISSEGENSFVGGLIESQTYIGLTDEEQEGVFTWQDGSAFSYSKWSSGPPQQPNEENDGTVTCVLMDTQSKWWDKPCSYRKHYICEKPLQ